MRKSRKRTTQFAFNAEKIFLAAAQPINSIYRYCQTAPTGLNPEEVEKRQSLYGKNEVEHEKKKIRFPPS